MLDAPTHMTSRISEEDLARLVAALEAGEDLSTVLGALIRAVEARQGGDGAMLGSILLLEGNRLVLGAAPSLPDDYNAAIDGIEIGPSVGSCGTAAYCGHEVFVVDIATDPLWKDFKQLALQHGLRACWSSPIIGDGGLGTDGTVLGTFALYYREQRSPNGGEREAIRQAAQAAREILERARRRSLAGTTPSGMRFPQGDPSGDLGHGLEPGLGDTLGA
jgi:GAF domain-containing protein